LLEFPCFISFCLWTIGKFVRSFPPPNADSATFCFFLLFTRRHCPPFFLFLQFQWPLFYSQPSLTSVTAWTSSDLSSYCFEFLPVRHRRPDYHFSFSPVAFTPPDPPFVPCLSDLRPLLRCASPLFSLDPDEQLHFSEPLRCPMALPSVSLSLGSGPSVYLPQSSRPFDLGFFFPPCTLFAEFLPWNSRSQDSSFVFGIQQLSLRIVA